MSQIPASSRCRSAARVSPEPTPAPVHPATAALGGQSEAIATPEARQFAVDLEEAKQLSFAALVVRHARVLSLLRVVWASRRHWQDCAEKLQDERDQLRGSIAAWHLHDRTQRDRIAELERVAERQVSEIADKGIAITKLRERVRSKEDRIAELEARER